MNTLLFLSGVGIGALISTLLFLLVMIRTTRKVSKEAVETIVLMKERNAFDQQKVTHLKHVADWCEHNWSRSTP